MFGLYKASRADLALWERRWTDADAAIQDGIAQARQREAAHIHVQMCAKGLRAQAELAALARARRDAGAIRDWLARARSSSSWPAARPRKPRRSRRTPVGGWPWPRPSMSGPAARHGQSRGHTLQRPGSGSSARRWWPTASGARARRSSRPAPPAPRRPCRCGKHMPSRPGSGLGRCSANSSCSPSAPGSISRPRQAAFPEQKHGPEEILGLTPREAQVLNLLARGYTNREIAAVLVISVKTVSVHVSHILRKLGAPNRLRPPRPSSVSPRHRPGNPIRRPEISRASHSRAHIRSPFTRRGRQAARPFRTGRSARPRPTKQPNVRSKIFGDQDARVLQQRTHCVRSAGCGDRAHCRRYARLSDAGTLRRRPCITGCSASHGY